MAFGASTWMRNLHTSPYSTCIMVGICSCIVFNSTKCWSVNLKLPSMAQYSLPRACSWIHAEIQTLQDLPAPNSQVKLRFFLGLINYLQLFMPGLSSKIMFLHGQLTKRDWNPSTDAAFQHLKAWICQTLLNTTLMYYDRSKPVIEQSDASK